VEAVRDGRGVNSCAKEDPSDIILMMATRDGLTVAASLICVEFYMLGSICLEL